MTHRPPLSQTTLPGALASEIRRVTELREHYREVGRMCGPQVIVGPAITLMSHALDAAVAAAGSPDIVGQIRALEDLRGFEK